MQRCANTRLDILPYGLTHDKSLEKVLALKGEEWTVEYEVPVGGTVSDMTSYIDVM